MAINKVVLNNEVQLDLTADTVDASHLATGYTAHNSAGELITGTMSGGGSSSNTLLHELVDRSIRTITASDLAGVTKIGGNAFTNCNYLYTISLPDTLQQIESQAFYYSGIAGELIIPQSVYNIGYSAFEGCDNLTAITIPSGVTEIKSNTFADCEYLESVIFANVSSLQDRVFINDLRLKSVTFKYDGVCTITNRSLYNGSNNSTIYYVPAKHLASYKTATYWSNYADRIKPYDAYVEENLPNQAITYGQTKTITVPLQNYETAPTTYSVTSTNTNFLGVMNISATKDAITFDIVGQGYQQTSTTGDINISVESNGVTLERSFTVTIYSSLPESTWKVNSVTNAPYTFTLNDNGYYESTNKGINSSYAMANIVIKNVKGKKVYIDCINNGESNTDFGILSEVNKELLLNNTIDTANVKKSFKGLSSTEIQTVEYNDAITTGTSETCSIYVKFRKDGSGSAGNDSLQFKVRFGED